MELETRRLRLRPLRDDDAPAIASGINNLNVSRNLARVPFPYHMADAQAFIALQRTFDPRTKVCGIAFRCAPDELIGVISYEWRAHEPFELGYWLRECCWGLGLMKEAAAAMVGQAMSQAGASELQAYYHDGNVASARILQGLGFEITGQRLSFSLAQGRDVPSTQLRLAQQKSRAS